MNKIINNIKNANNKFARTNSLLPPTSTDKSVTPLALSEFSIGRSMVEMLGVLAIIAVLSVGGIAGYSKAMEKWKTNKLITEYRDIIFGILEYIDDFRKIKDGTCVYLLQSLNLIPSGWQRINSTLNDGTNYVNIFARWEHIVIDIRLFPMDSKSGQRSKNFASNLCLNLFQNLAQPLHQTVKYVWLWKSSLGDSVYLYGDNYCAKNNICLKDATINELANICNSCDMSKQECNFVIEL